MGQSEHGPHGPREPDDPGDPGGPAGSSPLDETRGRGRRLSERARTVLDFERQAWKRSGPKEAAIRADLGLSSTRYYQLLGELIDTPDAYEYDPLLVLRLRQRRDERRRRKIVGREVDPRRR